MAICYGVPSTNPCVWKILPYVVTWMQRERNANGVPSKNVCVCVCVCVQNTCHIHVVAPNANGVPSTSACVCKIARYEFTRLQRGWYANVVPSTNPSLSLSVCMCVCVCKIYSVYGYIQETSFCLHLHADKRIIAVFLYKQYNTYITPYICVINKGVLQKVWFRITYI